MKITELIITLTWYYQFSTYKIPLILIFLQDTHLYALTYQKSTFDRKIKLFVKNVIFVYILNDFSHLYFLVFGMISYGMIWYGMIRSIVTYPLLV